MIANISTEHVNRFLKAKMETYRLFLGTTPKGLQFKLVSATSVNYNVSSIIGVAGKVKGSVSMSYPKGSALKSVSIGLKLNK